MSRGARLATAAMLAGACAPAFSDETAIVSAPRLLAVQSMPAEAPAGGAFVLTSLYVGPAEAEPAPALDWATCLLQPPSDQPGPVNPACFGSAPGDVMPLGTGPTARGAVPADACMLFGPDSPPPSPGQPSPRPTDPDATGGYYLPVVVEAPGGAWSVAPERITCPPSGVTEDVLASFTAEYRPNVNPAVASLTGASGAAAAVAVAPDAPGAEPLRVRPGAQLSLTASWPSCPSTPEPCAGAETYVSIDPTTHAIVARRESMVASWYATAGSFALDRSGRGESDPSTDATNEWTAPTAAGTVHLWVVLRDARGGVGWQGYTLVVQP